MQSQGMAAGQVPSNLSVHCQAHRQAALRHRPQRWCAALQSYRKRLMFCKQARPAVHTTGSPGKTYVKLACEGDRSRAIYTQAGEDGIGELTFADTAAVVFIVVHSAAVLRIKIRDNRSKAYLGQVISCGR